MRRMIARLAPAAVVCAVACGAQEPAAALERVLAEPLPAARRQAASELAKLSPSLDDWVALLRARRPATASGPGTRREEWPLWDGDAVVATEVWVHVPARDDGNAPLALLLAAHGTGGDGRGMVAMWRGVADAIGAVVIAPSEPGPDEGYRFSTAERTLHLEAIRRAQVLFPIDAERIFATGISRGGHLCWDLALRHPDRFAAIAPMIGSPRLNPAAGQNNLRYLQNVVGLPIRDLQGSQDDPLLVANLRLAFRRLDSLGARDARLIEFPELGHSFDFGAVDWIGFLGDARRDPAPTEVVRCVANTAEGRTSWCEVTAVDPREVKESFQLRVRAEEWERLDEQGQRERMQQEADALTARLAATRTAPGAIRLETRHVRAVRLLLTPAMLDPAGRVAVTWGGRTRRSTPRPSAAVLLDDFVERLDAGFLPVAELALRQ
ncbi:MAG: hypothetical protein IPM29_06105 [Planctomycetes bacterium]|nr:hypothetical protein [Planctomycetota bacterium]